MPHWLLVLVVVMCCLDAVCLVMLWALRRRGVTLAHTKFGPAVLFDTVDDSGETVRLINVRGTFQSASYVGDDYAELVCLYHQYFAEALDIAGGERGTGWLRSACVVGGGGYSFPKWLVAHCPQARVDVVEIDPRMTQLAREWFFLDRLEEDFHAERDGRLDLVEGDGWEYLRAAGGRRWDLVVNDAFAGKRPLGALSTEEGARLIHDHLSEGGLYCANVISALEGPKAATLREVAEVFKRELGHVYVFPERPEAPSKRGNNAFVACSQRLPIRAEYEW